MEDIYLTFSADDADAAGTLAAALEANGWTVADEWDPFGEGPDPVSVVIALWSASALEAGWVEDEAATALSERKLVQALVGDVRPPKRLRRPPPVDLVDWEGGTGDPALAELFSTVAAILRQDPEDDPVLPDPSGGAQDIQIAVAGAPEVPPALWQAAPEGRLEVLAGHHAEVYDLAFSHDGSLLGSASADGKAAIWDVADGRGVARLEGHQDEINDVAFSHGDDLVATASDDGTVRVWWAHDWTLRREFSYHADGAFSVEFSPTADLIASVGGDEFAALWRPGDGDIVWELEHTDEATTVRFLPDGTVLAVAADDGTVVLWDVETGQALTVLSAHDDAIADMAVSPAGTLLAASSDAGGVAVTRIADGMMHWWATDLAGSVVGLAFSPDGRLLAGSDDDGITLWDVRTGEPIAGIGDPDASRLEFSPSGQALAWASGPNLRLLKS